MNERGRSSMLSQMRGQLTIFVIIAILVFAIIFILFVARGGLTNKLSPDAERVYLFVQDCLDKVGTNGIYLISLQGGYYIPPNLSIEYGIPYYYFNNVSHMPSKLEVQKQISNYIDDNLAFCINDFSDFTDLTITKEKIRTNVQMIDEKVILNVNYPIVVIKDESSTLLKEFVVEIPIRLEVIYDSIEKIIKQQLTHEGICLSCVLDIALENDLYVDMSDYNGDTTIFIFKDENSKINNETLEFVFANKY